MGCCCSCDHDKDTASCNHGGKQTHHGCHEHEHDGCCHCHSHEEGPGKTVIVCICLSAALLTISLLFLKEISLLIGCLAAYLIVGWPVLKEALEGLLNGRVFDENFLMTIASVGAFFIGEYPEAVAVMLLYQIGEALQSKAVRSSRKSIRALVNIRPDQANWVKADGEILQTAAAEIPVGALILVRPGERIPLDGIVREGSSLVDTSPLTGESIPREIQVGDSVFSGCLNQQGSMQVEVTHSFEDSSASRILALVEEAQENKAPQERFITKFARIYTPIVVLAAVLLAVIPPLAGLGSWQLFLHKALSFLVISCPCALVISVPLTFFAGIGCASRNGILFKGSTYLELLAKAECAAFDKTGTLTEGSFQVTALEPAKNCTQAKLLVTAAYCESLSTHPLAKAIIAACQMPLDPSRLTDMQELAGKGIRATLDGKIAYAGKYDFLQQAGIQLPTMCADDTAIYVALDGEYLGRILLQDEIKADTASAIKDLRHLGINKLSMLSGDRTHTAQMVGQQLGMDRIYAELLPEEKVSALQQLKGSAPLIYVGDGINDAPVLAAADIGVAMGGLGSDAAIEAADLVIMSDELSKLPQAIQIARKTLSIAKQNILFSLAIKLFILLLSMFLNVGIWLAVFADVGICMLAILNALRATKHRSK